MKLYRTAAAAAALIAVTSGCGQMKSQDQKILSVEESQSGARRVQQSRVDSAFEQFKQLFQLYSQGGAIDRAGMKNLLDRYKDKVLAFLEGTPFTPDDLINILFSFDTDHDGKITPGDVADGLMKRIPILRWIPDNQTTVTLSQLNDAIASDYPQSSAASRTELAETLMSYDRPWAGGNGDGKVTRSELAPAGLILGVLADTDFTKPLALPGQDKDNKIVIENVEARLNQQLFGRSTQLDYRKLAPTDIQLEWMQFSMKFYLMYKLTHAYSDRGLLDLANPSTADALSQFGIDQRGHWDKLRSLYDSPIMGGDGDLRLNTIEAFMYMNDLNFAGRGFNAAGGDLSSGGIKRMPNKNYFLSQLMTVFPRTGQSLFMGDLDAWKKDHWAVRDQFWDGLRLYDETKYGGNGDGKLDLGEFAMALAYCRIVDNLYLRYAGSKPDVMTKDEARVLFKDVLGKAYDATYVDAFFADLGLDGGSVTFWDKFKAFFSGKTHINELEPFEFYIRLVKVMPRLPATTPAPDSDGDSVFDDFNINGKPGVGGS